MPKVFNPYFQIVFATMIWGSTGVFVKYLALPPTTLTFFRVGVPTIVLGIFFGVKKVKLFRQGNKLMLLASLLNAIRLFFYFWGFTLASIGNSYIMLYTWPIFGTILSMIFLGEKISRKQIFLLVVAFIGIAVIFLDKEFSFQNDDFLGMLSMVLAAFIYSSTVVIFKKETNSFSEYETLFYQNFVGAIIFLPFIFINEPFPTLNQINIATTYAVLIGVLGFGLFFSALKKIKVSTASFLSYTEVVSGILYGVIFFDEVITWNILLGGSMIIMATILIKK